MAFSSLGLDKTLLRAIAEQGYSAPTPIQSQAIPAVLAGRDLLAAAQTGTGKTAALLFRCCNACLILAEPVSARVPVALRASWYWSLLVNWPPR